MYAPATFGDARYQRDDTAYGDEQGFSALQWLSVPERSGSAAQIMRTRAESASPSGTARGRITGTSKAATAHVLVERRTYDGTAQCAHCAAVMRGSETRHGDI